LVSLVRARAQRCRSWLRAVARSGVARIENGSLVGRKLDACQREGEVTMAQSKEPATNERIVRLLEEIKEQLADVSKRQEQMAHDLARLLKHA
jgi:hypothetical protein